MILKTSVCVHKLYLSLMITYANTITLDNQAKLCHTIYIGRETNRPNR